MQRAWKYLQYKGFPPPPPGGPWTRPTLAVIDCGFDIDPTTGIPALNNPDYDPFFNRSTCSTATKAGGNCSASLFDRLFGQVQVPWHGQASFSVAAAVVGNGSGSAGVGGTVAIPMVMKSDVSQWTLSDGIRSAALRGASVISVSFGNRCLLLCDLSTDMEIRIGASAGFAVNQGAIVVVSAGNNRIDIGDSRRFPCTVNNTICVGAVDRKFANLGNFGAKVDIWNRRRHSDDT